MKTMFYCKRLRWLNLIFTAGASHMQNPQPFTVYQSTPGQNARPIFVIHAYSIEVARAIVAAKVAGKVIVVALDGASR
jgi:hypothetical protein